MAESAATPQGSGRRRAPGRRKKASLPEIESWAAEQRQAGFSMEDAMQALADNAGAIPPPRDPIRGDTVMWRGNPVQVDLVSVSGNVVILTPEGRKVVRKEELACPPVPPKAKKDD